MFKKSKSTLALTLSVAMLATMVTIPGVASAATSTQLAGKDRYETALKIVEAGWTSSTNAIITTGEVMADALSAAPLAYAKGQAPILLTKKNEIPAGVLNELKTLGVTNVYIVGGVGAVSKTVADQLAAAGLTITRVEGKNRFETSLAVAKAAFGVAPAEVVIANGLAYADALSVSSVAARKGMPILLVDNTGLSADQAAYISGKTVYAVGGTGVLNAAVVTAAKAERLSGLDRYETNAAILAKFKPDYSKIYLAKGTPANLVDALAGSVLAAKTNSPVVLVDENNAINTKLADVVKANITASSSVVKLGGTVTDVAAAAIENLKAKDLAVTSVSAINAKEILVTFNKEVNEATAETITSYQLQGANVTGTATLQTDKKSVIIELTSPLVNGQSYALKVKKDLIQDGIDVTKTAPEFNYSFFFNDTVKPVVSSVETLESGSVKVNFSERIATGTNPSIVINGTTVPALNVSVDASGMFATAVVTGLTKGTSYQIIVTSAQDVASPTANVMSLYSGTFVYNILSDAPVAKTITTKGEKTIVVEFTEALSTALLDGSTLKVTKNGVAVTAGTITPVGVKYEVALPASIYATGETAVTLGVTLEGYKDAQGNVGLKNVQNVSLTKDVVAPVVKETKFDAATDRLNVKFDETLIAATAAAYAPAMYVTDVNGVRYNVSTTADLAGSVTEVLTVANIATGGDTLSLNTSELANGTYTFTILANTFTDEASAANQNKVVNVNFTVTDSVVSAVPAIAGATITKGQIIVNFDAALKGGNVVGSATSYLNYSINGVVIPSTSSIYLDSTKQIVTITLPAATVAKSGVKLLTVKGIQGTNGVVMAETTRAETFVDDTKPVLLTAVVDATNVLNLKFSEALVLVPAATTDLEIAINGTVITGYTAVAVAGKVGEYTIAAPSGFSFGTGTITVKVNTAATAADSATNVLTTGTVITATR